MEAKDVRLSEHGRDALYDLVNAWLDKHFPDRAAELRESSTETIELVEAIREVMRCEVALQLTNGPIKAPSGG